MDHGTDNLHARLKEAKIEMEHAQEEMLKNALCNEKFRRFIETRETDWKLADEWVGQVFGKKVIPPETQQSRSKTLHYQHWFTAPPS